MDAAELLQDDRQEGEETVVSPFLPGTQIQYATN